MSISLAIFKPLGFCQSLAFWTMTVAAGIIGIPFMATLTASFEMAAKFVSATSFY